MSLTLIRPYFRSRFEALGFKEWEDGFNFENIPSTLFDRSFHLGPIDTSSINLQNCSILTTTEIEVEFFLKGYRTPAESIDAGILEAENIIKEVMKASNRLGAGLKNVIFDNMIIEPFSDQNDNLIAITMRFTNTVYIQL